MIKSVTHKYVKVICIDNLHADVRFSLSLCASLYPSVSLTLFPSLFHSHSIPPSNLSLSLSLSLPPSLSLSLSRQYYFVLFFFN